MQVTRPQLPASGPLTRADLQELNNITVALEQDDVDQLADQVQAQLGSTANRNYLRNPGVDVWSRGTGPLHCEEGVRTLLADDWWTRCNVAGGGGSMGSGGTLPQNLPTYERVSLATPQDWLWAAKITGDTGVGSVDFGQDLRAHVATGLFPQLTLTFDIYNATGASFAPEVRLDTCNAFESFSSTTNRLSVTSSTMVPDGTSATITVTLDTSAIGAQLRNGGQIYIRIPTGRLASTGSSVRIYALKLELGDSATGRYVERDLPQANGTSSGSSTTSSNYLRNGDFSRWLQASSTTCAEDADTYLALGWAANPSDGSTLTYSRSTTVPSTDTLYSAALSGAPEVTGEVDFVQNIPAPIAAEMRRELTFSVWIYNGTSDAFQVQLRLDTAGSYDKFTATTNQASSSAACAAGAWTRVSLPFNGATATNIANGARLGLRFPAGVFDSGSKLVRIAQAQIDPGVAAATYNPRPLLDAPGILSITRNLRVTRETSTTVSILCDEVQLTDAAGGGIVVRNAAYILDITQPAGAGSVDTGTIPIGGGMYHLWLIAQGEQVSAIVSTSATAPTLPDGYRYRARIGAFRIESPTSIRDFAQRGAMVFIQPGQVFSASVTTAGTYQLVDVSAYVPSWALSFGVELRMTSNNNMRVTLAANTAGLAEQVFAAPAAASPEGSTYASARCTMPVIGTPGLQIKASANTPTYQLHVPGYILP